MSQMDDPRAPLDPINKPLSDDPRFQNSETSTIDPLHAIMRAIHEAGSNPMDPETIQRVLTDHRSPRMFTPTEMQEQLDRGVREEKVELIDEIGYRLTENGRNDLGPILEMEIQYV